jgi:hypothetical protein
VLAHLWDVNRRSAQTRDTPDKSIETINGHHYVGYTKYRNKRPVADRDYLARFIWRAKGRGFVLVSQDTLSPTHPVLKDVVRATSPFAMRISSVNTNETKLEYVTHPDYAGGLPSIIFNSYMKVNLSRVTAIQEYFLKTRRMEQYDEYDGRALGYRRECRATRASEGSANKELEVAPTKLILRFSLLSERKKELRARRQQQRTSLFQRAQKEIATG